jgi:hypothetical protein
MMVFHGLIEAKKNKMKIFRNKLSEIVKKKY